MIRFQCPACNKRLKAPDEGVGQKTSCPRCGQRLYVPPPVRGPVPTPAQNKTVLGKPEQPPPEWLDDVRGVEDKRTPQTAFHAPTPLPLPDSSSDLPACEPIVVEPAHSLPDERDMPPSRYQRKRAIAGIALTPILVIVVMAVLGMAALGVVLMVILVKGPAGQGGGHYISKAEFERIVFSAQTKQEIIDKLGRPDVTWPSEFLEPETWGYDYYVIDPVSQQPYGRALIKFGFAYRSVRYIPILTRN